jgi:hypothetical protein
MSAMPPFLMKSEFHPDGIYRFNIDTDGDAQARQPEPAGEVLIAGTPVPGYS